MVWQEQKLGKKCGKKEQYHQKFLVKAVFDQLPTPPNLVTWGKQLQPLWKYRHTEAHTDRVPNKFGTREI